MVAKHSELSGRLATITVEGLTIRVVVEDIREVWGKTQAQITPSENGYGHKWVNFSRLTLTSDERRSA